MSNPDLKALALQEFDPDKHEEDEEWVMPDAQKWGQGLGVSKSTVYEWVGHFIGREKATRETKAVRLAALGWTQEEIGKVLGVDRSIISKDVQNSELGKIHTSLGKLWNDAAVTEWARRMAIPRTDALAAAMVGMSDGERLKKLDIKIQPYDVWNFSSCHDLMGDEHPGRIPGELICHALYFMTKPGDLALKMKDVVAAKAKENKRKAGSLYGENHPQEVSTTLSKPLIPVNTRAEISKQSGVSEGTIAKIETNQKKASPKQIERLESGDASINIPNHWYLNLPTNFAPKSGCHSRRWLIYYRLFANTKFR